MTDHHAGEDVDDVSMDDVQEEDAAAEAREDAIMGGEFETGDSGETDYPREEVNNSACRWCQEMFETISAERTHDCRDRKEARSTFDRQGFETIRPQVHEIGAKWLFAPRAGLGAYFAWVSEFDRCMCDVDREEDVDEDAPEDAEDGSTWVAGDDEIGTFEAAGETWKLNHDEEKVKYWEGGIRTREGDSGETYYEYQVGVVAADDTGRKRINFQVRPSLPNAIHHESGDPIKSLPDDLPEGMRVQVDAANVDPDEFLDVWQALLQELTINPAYCSEETMHEWSQAYNAALYVRLDRDISEDRVVSKDALLDRLARFSSQQRGRGQYEWDNEEIMGHRNVVTMNDTGCAKLYPGHHLGKNYKSYHMKNPEENVDPERPTTQPKLEVQWATDFCDGDHQAVPWNDPDGYDLQDVLDELDEWLINGLHWAGLPTKPTEDVYVEDAYWPAEGDDREVTLHPDPMPALEEHERDVATQVLGADLTEAQQRVFEVLADGGQPMSHDELAEEADTSSSTVYRAIGKAADVVARVDGKLSMADDVIRERVQDLLDGLDRAVERTKRALSEIEAGAEDVSVADDSPFAKWLRRYGVGLDLGRRGEDMELTVHNGEYEKYEIREVLRAGLDAADRTGSELLGRLLESEVVWWNESGDRQHAVNPFPVYGSGSIRILGAPTRRSA